LNPSFDAGLVDVLSELEHLRRLQLGGDTPPAVFLQLKELFHTLESLGSARIEGNHTTLADYIESKVEGTAQATDQLREIANIERAMEYIESIMESGSVSLSQTICPRTQYWCPDTCKSWSPLSIKKTHPNMT